VCYISGVCVLRQRRLAGRPRRQCKLLNMACVLSKDKRC